MRVDRVEPAHDAVANDLGHDRRGSDGGAPPVSPDDGQVLGRIPPQPEAVHETDLRGRRERVQDLA